MCTSYKLQAGDDFMKLRFQLFFLSNGRLLIQRIDHINHIIINHINQIDHTKRYH